MNIFINLKFPTLRKICVKIRVVLFQYLFKRVLGDVIISPKP